MPRRIFIPQETLTTWVEKDVVSVKDNIMSVKADGRQFQLAEAVRFLEVEGGESDSGSLIGKVKTLEHLAEINAECYRSSVLVGEIPYKVQEGFLGELSQPIQPPATSPISTLAAPSHPISSDAPQSPLESSLLASSAASSPLAKSLRQATQPAKPSQPSTNKEEESDEELLTRFLLDHL